MMRRRHVILRARHALCLPALLGVLVAACSAADDDDAKPKPGGGSAPAITEQDTSPTDRVPAAAEPGVPLGHPVPGSATPIAGTTIPELPTRTVELADGTQVQETDWNEVDPLAFLDALVAKAQVENFVVVGIFTTHGWINASHVPPLLERCSSTRPAAHVVASKSSILPFGRHSAEGVQALYLLEGYRTGQYPPTLSSYRFEPDEDAFREWWANR